MKTRLETNPLLDGIMLVDKPREWTSHDVCHFIRRRFRIKKVGHAGTLDPNATGLLVVLLGRATKQSASLMAGTKDYSGTMKLGLRTGTHDITGEVLETAGYDKITLEMLQTKAADFTGEIEQVPPMVSALKHKGTPLYKLARKGKEVPREGRMVQVHEFRIESLEGDTVHFHVSVSKGTYVRTLVNDLGESLGCFATLGDLRRTRSGNYSLENSVTTDFLKTLEARDLSRHIIPLYEVLRHENSDPA